MAISPIKSVKKHFQGTNNKGPIFWDKFLIQTSDLLLTKGDGTVLTENVDYTVTLGKKSSGLGYLSARIDLTKNLLETESLTVELNIPISQTVNYTSTIFDLEQFESSLDKIALLTAQSNERASTSLAVPATLNINTQISGLIPSSFLRFKSDMSGIESVGIVNLNLGATLTPTNNYFISGTGSAWATSSPSSSRTVLGTGSIATQSASSVTITGGVIAGITPLTVLDGGTGANNISDAQVNLGVVIGTNVQAYSAELAGLAAYNTNGIVVRSGSGTYTGRTLVASTGLTMTNGTGVSGNPTLSYNISALTEETSPLVTDTLLIQKQDGSIMKTKIQNLPSYNQSGAPAGSSYLTISSSGSLTAERTATAGSAITLTDGGANSTLTASVNINGLTVDGSPDLLNDYIMTYDASASGLKKTLLNNVKGYNGSYKMLLSNSFSGVTAVNFSSTYITSTYSAYAIVLTNYVDTNGTGVLIQFSVDNGSTFLTSTSTYQGRLISTETGSTTITNTNASSNCRFLNSPDLAATAIVGSGVFYIFGPSRTTSSALYHSSYSTNATPVIQQQISGGKISSGSAINYIRLTMPSNATGRVTLYGIL